jgi:pimeloyl-ACP methyl ester carboxylesterase
VAALPFLLGGCVPRTLVPDGGGDLVVLVHGMGRTQFAMAPMGRMLRARGFQTLNVGYNSFTTDVEGVAEGIGEAVAKETARTRPARIHFVTHSLGGIAVRQLLRTDRPPRLGRVVMLAPPNQGSRSADRWTPWVGWLLRPISQLRTENSAVAAMPPPRGVEVAVIAGDADAKVSLAESRLEGAAEHVVVESAHTFIMMKPSVADLTACFLRTGATACEASEMGSSQ